MILGQNPLLLLHAALSKDLHGKSDEEALEAAHSVRTILTTLATEIAHVTREQRDIEEAVKSLLKYSEGAD